MAAIGLASGLVRAESNPDSLSSFLVDFAGPINAGGIVGLSGSSITDIQTLKDFNVALTGKGSFGLSVTPGRTQFLPIKATEYGKPDAYLYRLLASTTIGYAENPATIASVAYKKRGVALSAHFYLHSEDDPIIKAYAATNVENCTEWQKAADAQLSLKPSAPGYAEALKKNLDEQTSAAAECMTRYFKAHPVAWNDSQVSISLGTGRIRPDSANTPERSLGSHLVLGTILKTGDNGGTNVTLSRIQHEADLTTLAANPVYKDTSLAAARYTYGASDLYQGKLHLLVEVSNAKSSTVTDSSASFKHAVGLDYQIATGLYAQFRLGRNRTIDNTTTQTTSLFTVNWSPTSSLFK
jgi:hypothetical protein